MNDGIFESDGEPLEVRSVRSFGMSWGRDGSVSRSFGDEHGTVEEVATLSPETDDIWALNQLKRVYTCGCGRPETAYELVRSVLRLMPLYEDGGQACEQLVGSEGALLIVLDVMTNARLIEHGGGIGGSWVRPEGERLLAILNGVEDIEAWADRIEEKRVTWMPRD